MTEKKASILLLENDPLLCDLIQLSLEQEGYSVIVERNARQQLELIIQNKPDILLLDLFYPQTQTIQLIREIQQLPLEPAVDIIVLSALGFREVVQKALDAGAKEYLLKPIEVNLLIERVNKLYQLRLKREEKTSLKKPIFRRLR